MTTFYDYMVSHYSDAGFGRGSLARDMMHLAETYPQVKKIDSFYDLVSLLSKPEELGLPERGCVSGESFHAAIEELWCEYCAECNHPI